MTDAPSASVNRISRRKRCPEAEPRGLLRGIPVRTAANWVGPLDAWNCLTTILDRVRRPTIRSLQDFLCCGRQIYDHACTALGLGRAVHYFPSQVPRPVTPRPWHQPRLSGSTAAIYAETIDNARTFPVLGSTVTKRASGISSGIFVHQHHWAAKKPQHRLRIGCYAFWGARMAAVSSGFPCKNGQAAASKSNLRWLRVAATTFVITHSPSRSNRRDGFGSLLRSATAERRSRASGPAAGRYGRGRRE